MSRRIVVIQGHPDPAGVHFGHVLAAAYMEAAQAAGHDVRHILVAGLEFPLLRSKPEYETGATPAAIVPCQDDLRWAGHVVIFFPLWMGEMPALLKAFLEQLLRPGFVYRRNGARPHRPLAGKSARIVVTLGMPAFVYRWYFGGHGLRNLRRSILGFCGIRPIATTLIGRAEGMSDARRTRWIERLRALGRAGH